MRFIYCWEVFWTTSFQKDFLILLGILSLSYVVIFLMAPKDITDYTVADTEYWRETGNRLLLKTAYDYNNKEAIQVFPKQIGDWRSYDTRYPDAVYDKLNADILLSRAYNTNNSLVWMDIINSKVGSSFHKQRICVEGAGWNVDNESISEFRIASSSSPFIKLYANRLDISKGNRKQVMVYWFMFKKFGSNDEVTMIRLSSPVRYNVTATFDSMKSFVELGLFETMYERALPEKITVAQDIIRSYGNIGTMAIVPAVLIPLGILFMGLKRKN
jgi:hypothetical protein